MGLAAWERQGRRWLIALGALGFVGVAPVVAQGSRSRLVASATFSSPVAVGPVAATGTRVEQADLVQGAWLQFPGPTGEQLARIYENGHVQSVGLPPQMRDERLQVTPLQNGWTIAVDRYLPASRAGMDFCEGIEESNSNEPGCGDDWVVAEHSPRGRWALVQALPHSRGNRSWVSEPVEHNGKVEIAWGEPYEEAVRVAEAPLGRPFGPPHVVRHLLLRQFTDSVGVSVKLGGLYEVAEYGPDVGSGEPEFIAERRLYADGHFGPIHVLKSPLLYEKCTFFLIPDGSELCLYSTGNFKLLIARRPSFATGFERSHLLLAQAQGSPEETTSQAINGRLLIVSQEKVPPESAHELIAAIAVSPRGIPEPARIIEAEPSVASRYYADAIGDGGEWLVASTTDEGGPLWLHPSSPGCAYSERKIRAPTSVSREHTTLALSAGKRGVFHVAWVDPRNQLQSASVRVACAHRQSTFERQADAQRNWQRSPRRSVRR
jgi:hypothetical protein